MHKDQPIIEELYKRICCADGDTAHILGKADDLVRYVLNTVEEARTAERSRLRGEIEKKRHIHTDGMRCVGYNKAIDDILSLLQP